MMIPLLLLLSLYLDPLLARMNCPPGYGSEISIDSNRHPFVRCCNETSPGGIACARASTGLNTTGDFSMFCDQIFPILGVTINDCDCGNMCTGTVTQSGCSGPDCLCTMKYCCEYTGSLCNVSSPASYTVYTRPPTSQPTPQPTRAPTTHAPSHAPSPPTEAPTNSGNATHGTLAILLLCMALIFFV